MEIILGKELYLYASKLIRNMNMYWLNGRFEK